MLTDYVRNLFGAARRWCYRNLMRPLRTNNRNERNFFCSQTIMITQDKIDQAIAHLAGKPGGLPDIFARLDLKVKRGKLYADGLEVIPEEKAAALIREYDKDDRRIQSNLESYAPHLLRRVARYGREICKSGSHPPGLPAAETARDFPAHCSHRG